MVGVEFSLVFHFCVMSHMGLQDAAILPNMHLLGIYIQKQKSKEGTTFKVLLYSL